MGSGIVGCDYLRVGGNSHYLRYRQTVKLPILLYKPRLRNLKGTVSIKGPVRLPSSNSGGTKPGMMLDES